MSDKVLGYYFSQRNYNVIFIVFFFNYVDGIKKEYF